MQALHENVQNMTDTRYLDISADASGILRYFRSFKIHHTPFTGWPSWGWSDQCSDVQLPTVPMALLSWPTVTLRFSWPFYKLRLALCFSAPMMLIKPLYLAGFLLPLPTNLPKRLWAPTQVLKYSQRLLKWCIFRKNSGFKSYIHKQYLFLHREQHSSQKFADAHRWIWNHPSCRMF